HGADHPGGLRSAAHELSDGSPLARGERPSRTAGAGARGRGVSGGGGLAGDEAIARAEGKDRERPAGGDRDRARFGIDAALRPRLEPAPRAGLLEARSSAPEPLSIVRIRPPPPARPSRSALGRARRIGLESIGST